MGMDWPSLNSRAWLRLSCCGAEHPTRVEGFTEKGCILAAPSLPHTTDVDPRIAKDGFFLGWVNVHHALEVPAELVEATTGHLPTWTIEATGDVQETQRRAFVRLSMNLPIKLQLLVSGPPFEGEAVDLSEGGLRAYMPANSPDPLENAYDATFSLGGKEFKVRSQTAWWGGIESGRRAIGVRFLHDSPSVADEIRRYIFAEQLERRRRSNA